MRKIDYEKLTEYLEFALTYFDREQFPSARTEIENAKNYLEKVWTKKARSRS